MCHFRLDLGHMLSFEFPFIFVFEEQTKLLFSLFADFDKANISKN